MLMGALESGTHALLEHMFGPANLLSWLVNAPVTVPPPCRSTDAGDGSRRPLRAGAQQI